MFTNYEPEEILKLPKYSKKYEEVVNTPFLPEGVPALTDRLKGAKNYR